MRRGAQSLIILLPLLVVLYIFQTMSPATTSSDCPTIKSSRFADMYAEKIVEPIRAIVRQELSRAASNRIAADAYLSSEVIPTIFVITPTYKRQEQIPELTRLGQTLKIVPSIYWIVADDTNSTNPQVVDLLNFLAIPYTYLLTPMPDKYRQKTGAKPKGVANRNAGLEWVRKNAENGVIYFADDDNVYDIRLFEEIRQTQRVSMFPVGLVTNYGLSSPVLRDGKFVEFYDGWIGNRKFPVDMAGFAISVKYLLQVPEASMPFSAGYEETGMLKSLKIEPSELEFLAENCTKIYVWHTKTVKNGLSSRNILQSKYNNTNLRILQEQMMLKNAE